MKTGLEVKTFDSFSKAASESALEFNSFSQFPRPDLQKEIRLENSDVNDSLAQPSSSGRNTRIEDVLVNQGTKTVSSEPPPLPEIIDKEFVSDSEISPHKTPDSEKVGKENSEESIFIFTKETAKDEVFF